MLPAAGQIIDHGKETLLETREILRGYYDYWRLRRQVINLESLGEFARKFETAHREVYERYVQAVSNPEMAASFETLCWMIYYCKNKQPTRVLDLGSGISSYVFRFYQNKIEPSVGVTSVDDSREWKQKTEEFLRDEALDQTDVVELEDFERKSISEYDFIFYDLGSMNRRRNYLDVLLSHHRPGSTILLDDFHKYEYRKLLRETLPKHEKSLYSLRWVTLDRFGRYAGLVL